MRIKFYTFVFSFFLLLNFSFAQDGPGGVGNTTGTSELKMWLRADDCNCTDGYAVPGWFDASGSGNDVFPSGDASKPIFKENVINGMPGYEFNGSQFLQMNDASMDFSSTDATFFVVAKDMTQGTLIASAEDSWNNEMLLFDKKAYKHRSSGNFTVLEHQCMDVMPTSDAFVMSATFSNSLLHFDYYINGLQSSNFSTTAGSLWNFSEVARKVTIGQRDEFVNSEFLKGSILEVIVYNTVLSDEDRMNVEAYLHEKYQIAPESCTNIVNSSGPGGVGNTSGDSNLQLWLKSESCDNCNTGDPISQWNDQSGANNHVMVNGTFLKPSFQEDVLNGYPGITFNGNQYLQTDGAKSGFSNNESTFFVVALAGSSGAMVASAKDGWVDEMLLMNEQVYQHKSSGNFTTLQHQCIDDVPANEPVLLTATFGIFTSALSYRVNGMESTLESESYGSTPPFFTNDRIITIGQRDELVTSEFLNGTLLEVIVYNSELSEAERAQVESYLECKYNIENNTCGELTGLNEVDVDVVGDVLNANASGASYQWLDCDNNMMEIPGANDVTFSPSESGNYAVAVSYSSCQVVSDCVAFNSTTSAYKLMDDLDISIFPNPATDMIYIQQEGNDEMMIEVFNLYGSLQQRINSSNVNTEINIQDLTPGSYFVKVMIDGKQSVQKIIKQ